MVIAKAKDAYFTMKTAGQEIQCQILFTFEDDANGKQYVVYTDNQEDEEGNTRVFASQYDPEAEKITLKDIETEEEWALVSSVLAQYQEEMDKEEA